LLLQQHNPYENQFPFLSILFLLQTFFLTFLYITGLICLVWHLIYNLIVFYSGVSITLKWWDNNFLIPQVREGINQIMIPSIAFNKFQRDYQRITQVDTSYHVTNFQHFLILGFQQKKIFKNGFFILFLINEWRIWKQFLFLLFIQKEKVKW